jgi:hypothetical protein
MFYKKEINCERNCEINCERNCEINCERKCEINCERNCERNCEIKWNAINESMTDFFVCLVSLF